MEFLLVAVLIGLIPAFIAQGKGRSFIGFWIYGALLFIVALPHALIMKADAKSIEDTAIASGGRKCPYCAEIVKAEATVCRYCQRDLPVESDVFAMGRCESCGNTINMNSIRCPKCETKFWPLSDGKILPIDPAESKLMGQHHKDNGASESQLMEQYGIGYDGQYIFKENRYDKFSDALSFAKRQKAVG